MDDTLYKEYILELNRHPLNKKSLEHFDAEARELNPLCGDEITVRIVKDADGRIADVGFQGMGCAISQAGASAVTEAIKGKTAAEIRAMGKDDVFGLLGGEIIATRAQCALLALKTIQKALV
jgi:nitrogen fixation NifU-like protein